MANHYQTLGVPNFSSSKVVQKAFRRLALQYHPDKHGGDKIYEDKFKQINAAYQVLSDVRKKAIYDEQLLYGSRPKTTVNTTRSNKNPQTKPKKEKPRYEPKPEPKLTYSAFQKVFIKVSLAVMVLFAIIIVVFSSIHKEANPEKQLLDNYNALINRIEVSKKNKNFDLMEQQVDSIRYYNSVRSQSDVFSNQLCNEVNFYADDLLNNNKYTESKRYSELYERLCDKYNYPESVHNKVRKINIELNLENIDEARRQTKEIIAYHLHELGDGLQLTDILLVHDQFDYAELVISKTVDRLMDRMNSKYGALYLNVLENGYLAPRIKKAMIQCVCLNRNYKNKNRLILEDFISKVLTDKELSLFYTKSKSLDFSKEAMIAQGIPKEYKSILKELNLATFYK